MNFRLLEDFMALAECGNFTRAAELRHSTQSAFSRRIQNLEYWAGAPLFDRGCNPVRLTREGELFRPCAEDLLRRLHKARELVREEQRQRQRTVTIAATHSLALNYLPMLLHHIEQACGDVSTRLFSSQFDACVQALSAGQCHFFLTYTHPQAPLELDPEHFPSASIGQDTMVPVVGQTTRQAGANTPAPLLAYAPESGMGRIVQAVLGDTLGTKFTPVFESGYASVLKSMALEGYGTAWLPLRDIGAELQSGQLRRPYPGEWDIALDIRLFRPAEELPAHTETVWRVVTESA